jgi:hypothetical protein
MIIAGNKIYETCDNCGKLVQINKPFFGGLHLCNREPPFNPQNQYDVSQQEKYNSKALDIKSLLKGEK